MPRKINGEYTAIGKFRTRKGVSVVKRKCLMPLVLSMFSAACVPPPAVPAQAEPVFPTATEATERSPLSSSRMNREMLGRARTLHVQVDWIEGAEPEDGAIVALRRWLHRATGRESEAIHVRKGNRVAPESGETHVALARTALAHARPEPDSYFVYVLYWDRFEKYRGVCWPPGSLSEEVGFPAVTMFVKPIRRDSMLWLTRRKVESAVLVHEFGHLAGLVTSSRTAGKPGRSGHCPDPGCRMYWGVDGASFRRNAFPVLCLGVLPLDFCDACEAELAAGRE